MVAMVAVAFPSHHSGGPTLYNGCNGRGRLHFHRITPLGQRCLMVATVAVAFPSHHSAGPTLYNGCYSRGYISVTSLRWANVVYWLQRSRLHFRRTTPLGQRCIKVATVAVAFPSHHSVGPTLYNGCYSRGYIPSHHSVGPTLYNGCYGRGYISIASLRWANVV